MATALERKSERLQRFIERQKSNWPSVTDPIIKPKPAVPIPTSRKEDGGSDLNVGTKRNA